jgi:hypothetical protein
MLVSLANFAIGIRPVEVQMSNRDEGWIEEHIFASLLPAALLRTDLTLLL